MAIGDCQGVLLALHFLGHAIEGSREQRDLVLALLFLHADVKVSASDPLRRRRQSSDRPRQTLGKPQSEIHGRHDDKHCKTQIDRGELHQPSVPVLFKPVIERDALIGPLQRGKHRAINRTRDVKECVKQTAELDQRPHLVGGDVLMNDHFTTSRRIQVIYGRRRVGEEKTERPARNHLGAGIENVHIRETGFLDSGFQQDRESTILYPADHAFGAGLEPLRQGKRLTLYGLAMLLRIGDRDLAGRAHDRTNLIAEPRVKTELDYENEKHGHEQGRSSRDAREHRHHAHMHLGAGRTRSAGDDQTSDLSADQHNQQNDIEKVDSFQQLEGSALDRALIGARQHTVSQDREDRAKRRQTDRELGLASTLPPRRLAQHPAEKLTTDLAHHQADHRCPFLEGIPRLLERRRNIERGGAIDGIVFDRLRYGAGGVRRDGFCFSIGALRHS